MPKPAPPLVRLALVFYGLLLGAAALWTRLAQGGEEGQPQLGWLRELLYASPEAAARGVDPLRDAGAGALVGLGVVVLSGWFARGTRAGERLARALAALLGRRTPGECCLLAAVSGVAEEAFFRGAMQPQLGLVATSVLFALAHFLPRRDLLPWSAFSLAAGFVLGGLFALTGNLVAPVVAHAVVNGVNLWRLSRDYAAG
jgi:hypothetical protein